MNKDTVLRHSITVRWTHWLIAISGILLLFSGFGQFPMYNRYNLDKIPGFSWSSNYEITLFLHYLFAALFTAVVVYHIVYHLRRREFAIMPRVGDVAQTIATVKAMLGKGEEPLHGKFQAKQRLAYGAIGGASLLLVVTGLIKSWKNIGNIVVDPVFLQVVTTIHTVVGILFLPLFLVHVAAVLLYRPLFFSMFSGRISKKYAQEHHPGWQTD